MFDGGARLAWAFNREEGEQTRGTRKGDHAMVSKLVSTKEWFGRRMRKINA